MPGPETTTSKRIDPRWVLGLTLLGFLLRAYLIGYPAEKYFDEIYYVEAAQVLWNGGDDPNSVHPPLGKWIIGLFIKIGEKANLPQPVSWRLVSLVLGTACIPLGMWLGFMLSDGDELVTILSGAFLALDFLHLVQSRIAMLDMPLAFFCLLGLCLTLHFLKGEKLWPVAIAAAVCFGLATGCKWSGLFAATGAWGGALLWDLWRGKKLQRIFVLGLIFAAVIPVVFLGSYSHHFLKHGVSIESVKSLGGQADRMVKFRYDAEKFTHNYKSSFWQWPLLARPVWYHYKDIDGKIRGIVAIGGLFFWWSFLIFLLDAVIVGWRDKDPVAGFLTFNYLANWGLWAVSTTGGFIYYMLLNVPIMAALVAVEMKKWLALPGGRKRIAIYLGILLLNLLLFYPLLVGHPVPKAFFHALFPFKGWI